LIVKAQAGRWVDKLGRMRLPPWMARAASRARRRQDDYVVERLSLDGKWIPVFEGTSGRARAEFLWHRRDGANGVRCSGLGLFIDRRGGLHQERRSRMRVLRRAQAAAVMDALAEEAVLVDPS
jgi:hypothetical protein